MSNILVSSQRYPIRYFENIDRKTKRINKVVLTIMNHGVKVDKKSMEIWIPSLKLKLEYRFRNDFKKINQIEINKEYAFRSVSLPEPERYETEGYIGVDLTTTGHCAVVWNPKTGKVLKRGKMAYHIHKKYKSISRYLQTKGKYRKVKQISVDPEYTSQECSRCGLIGNRNGKVFKCPTVAWPCWRKCCVQYSIASRHRSICCRQRCNRRENWYP